MLIRIDKQSNEKYNNKMKQWKKICDKDTPDVFLLFIRKTTKNHRSELIFWEIIIITINSIFAIRLHEESREYVERRVLDRVRWTSVKMRRSTKTTNKL